MSERRVHVTVSGQVQGVFFRDFTQDTASKLGLSGWVRNTSEGTVEAEFQGPNEAVEQALAACREGSSQAEVNDVSVQEMDPDDGASGFEVR